MFLGVMAANRDPAAFPDPDRFDVTRHPTSVMTFGFGVHFCLGASLARHEATSALDALVPWLAADQELAGAGADEHIDSSQFRGRRRLELIRKEA